MLSHIMVAVVDPQSWYLFMYVCMYENVNYLFSSVVMNIIQVISDVRKNVTIHFYEWTKEK